MTFRAQQALIESGLDPDRIAVALPLVDPAAVNVRVASPWFRTFWAKGISAVAMPWGIYVHPDRLGRADVGRLVVHELAHIDQWRRLGPVGWARSYLGDYLRGRRAGLRHHDAYWAVGLEKEARDVAARIAG